MTYVVVKEIGQPDYSPRVREGRHFAVRLEWPPRQPQEELDRKGVLVSVKISGNEDVESQRVLAAGELAVFSHRSDDTWSPMKTLAHQELNLIQLRSLRTAGGKVELVFSTLPQ